MIYFELWHSPLLDRMHALMHVSRIKSSSSPKIRFAAPYLANGTPTSCRSKCGLYLRACQPPKTQNFMGPTVVPPCIQESWGWSRSWLSRRMKPVTYAQKECTQNWLSTVGVLGLLHGQFHCAKSVSPDLYLEGVSSVNVNVSRSGKKKLFFIEFLKFYLHF